MKMGGIGSSETVIPSCQNYSSTLKMEEAGSTKMVIPFYRSINVTTQKTETFIVFTAARSSQLA
jgi:hypothetical protein